MPKTALVPIADGTEEIEAVTIIDTLRRAGVAVTVASVGPLKITASRGVKLEADCLISHCRGKTYDLVVLPGGLPGAEHLRDSRELTDLLKAQKEANRPYAAICASPGVVLQHHGLIGDHKATAYPGFEKKFADQSATASRVVTDGNVVTSRGPGTAMEFSLKLVEILCGKQKADEIAGQMLAKT